MKNIRKNFQKAFTLVELLVVIGILAILTAVVLVAVNPARQLAQARNTERQSEVNSVLSAITAYMADPINNGAPPAGMTTCSGGTVWSKIGTSTAAGFINLSTAVAPTYIADMPIDPNGTAADTGYDVCSTGSAGGNRITVKARTADLGATIEVTR